VESLEPVRPSSVVQRQPFLGGERALREHELRRVANLGERDRDTLNLLDRMGLDAPPDFRFEPSMQRQSDALNDDWVRRFSELRLGTEFDLVPAVPAHTSPGQPPG